MTIFRKWLWCFAISLVFFSATAVEAQIPLPARIGGTVTVNGTQLTQATDTGYTFVATKQNGTSYVPAAEDTDGLNASDWYLIDIPIYNATHQPGGANPGDTAVIHVYKNGTELTVTSPGSGQFTVGAEGSTTQMNLEATAGAAAIPTMNEWGMIILSLLMAGSALWIIRKRSRKTC